jgi:prepilin-type N-terminal cleavage/methylation domain-containing protein
MNASAPHAPSPDEQGFTMVEMLVVLAIMATIATIMAVLVGSRPSEPLATEQTFVALVAQARAIAEISGNGATLVVQPTADGGHATITLLRGRPFVKTSGAIVEANDSPVEISVLPVLDSGTDSHQVFSILFASDGSLSYILDTALQIGTYLDVRPGQGGANVVHSCYGLELPIAFAAAGKTGEATFPCPRGLPIISPPR